MRHCLNENSQGSKWLGEKLRHHQPRPPCSAELFLGLSNPAMAIETYKDVFANCKLSLARRISRSQAERVEDVKVLRSYCTVLIQVRLPCTTKLQIFKKLPLLTKLLRKKRQAGGRTWNIPRRKYRGMQSLLGPIISSTTLTLSYKGNIMTGCRRPLSVWQTYIISGYCSVYKTMPLCVSPRQCGGLRLKREL